MEYRRAVTDAHMMSPARPDLAVVMIPRGISNLPESWIVMIRFGMGDNPFDRVSRIAMISGGNLALGSGMASSPAVAAADIVITRRDVAGRVRATGRRLEDLAGTVVFFRGRTSDYVAGASITVDGDFLIRD